MEKLKFRFSQNLKRIRKEANFTQQKLAEIADIDYKYLQKIEGKTPPNITIETIEKLSKALKQSPMNFFL